MELLRAVQEALKGRFYITTGHPFADVQEMARGRIQDVTANTGCLGDPLLNAFSQHASPIGKK